MLCVSSIFSFESVQFSIMRLNKKMKAGIIETESVWGSDRSAISGDEEERESTLEASDCLRKHRRRKRRNPLPLLYSYDIILLEKSGFS